jgi:hypothetical protein
MHARTQACLYRYMHAHTIHFLKKLSGENCLRKRGTRMHARIRAYKHAQMRPRTHKYTGVEVVSAEKQSAPLPSLHAHCSRFSNYVMKNGHITCKYTITVQFTDLEKLLSHRKHDNGGDCFSAETTSGPVHARAHNEML